MRYAAEPAWSHAREARTAVLLVNLGTPEAPTPRAVRRYLAVFLADPRVVELPRLLWWPLLHGVVLRVRPRRSAAKYASIWTPQGSPLLVHTRALATALRGGLQAAGVDALVEPAMRYGQPSIGAGLDALKAAGAQRILLLPLYPQYSGATTASAFDAAADWSRRVRWLPELRLATRYHDEPAYIDALAASVREHWAQSGRAEMLVMSFHGMPARTLELGDPYHCECQTTGRLLAEALQLPAAAWRVTFQSRFGRARWLQPYTEPTLRALAADGVRRVDVICPGFAADCLETLEEIAQEGRAAFVAAGGTSLHYIACLNDAPLHVAALTAVALRHLQGWPGTAAPAHERDATLQRARAAGAPR